MTRSRGRPTVTDRPAPALLDRWDELVCSVPRADVAQLPAWARLRRRAGWTAQYVLLEDGARLVAGAQILVRRVPVLGNLGYVPYGPLVAPSAERPEEALDVVTNAVARLGRERISALFVQPPAGAGRVTETLLDRGFRASNAGIAPRASLVVDLEPDEAQLRQNLSRRVRKWTNRWEARGIVVRPATRADVPVLAALLAATAREQGFTPFGADYLAAVLEELGPRGHVVGFIGEACGRPAAMGLMTGCGGVLKARLTGFDRSSEQRALNVPAAVEWTAIRWAKAHGYRWYDLGGVREEALPLLEHPDGDVDALSGPEFHKARFGGRPFRYPEPVELIRPKPLRLAYDVVRRTATGRAALGRAQRLARIGRRPRSATAAPGAAALSG